MAEKIRVGNVEIAVARDADFAFVPTLFMPKVPADAWKPYLGGADPTSLAESRVLTFVVRSQGKTILVDAGVGTASDAAIAMELGCDGVLMNTAIAAAKDPIRMARAMKLAVEGGRLAYLAGRMPRKLGVLRFRRSNFPSKNGAPSGNASRRSRSRGQMICRTKRIAMNCLRSAQAKRQHQSAAPQYLSAPDLAILNC